MSDSAGDAAAQTAVILHLDARGPHALRDADAALEEAVGLCAAIRLDPIWFETWPLRAPRASTLLPKGQLGRLIEVAQTHKPSVVVVDADLSPLQQRNLERALTTKVIDRTGLILEIFGARARTREGAMQVELAALSFQRTRLVRSWTHLERQRGGFGFLGGPGESQLEIDRRLIDDRIDRLKRDLRSVSRTRGLQRTRRLRNNAPTVALVGYTNAGKSTLFNALSGAQVRARDLLFATLDPTMRRMPLPEGGECVLSDTVGFVSRLPTLLVAAFKATLEEVTEADLVLHVRDIAHADAEAQKEDVERVLSELSRPPDPHSMIEVWNKIDALATEDRGRTIARAADVGAVAVSARDGIGLDALGRAIAGRLRGDAEDFEVFAGFDQGDEVARLHAAGAVRRRADESGGVRLIARLPAEDAERLRSRGVAVTPIAAGDTAAARA